MNGPTLVNLLRGFGYTALVFRWAVCDDGWRVSPFFTFLIGLSRFFPIPVAHRT